MASTQNPILKNVETGQIIEIFKSPFTIGRALTCDYVIENKIVSRTHCRLTKIDEGWTLTDSSTNGTLVNEGHYLSNTSPVLKHEDEISLGYQSYTYKFMTEFEKIANCQVERLRNEQTANATIPNEVERSPGPSTPNSFEDNGVSDDVLNGVCDKILKDAQREIDNVERLIQEIPNFRNEEVDTSSTSQANHEAVSQENLEESPTSTLRRLAGAQIDQSKPSCSTSDQLQQSPEISAIKENHPGFSKDNSKLPESHNWNRPLGVNKISDSSVQIEGKIAEVSQSSQSQMNSSASTVIYSLSEEIPSQPDINDMVGHSTNMEQAHASNINLVQNKDTDSFPVGINMDVIPLTVRTLKYNILPEPKNHLAETIEEVVSKYSRDTSSSTNASTSNTVTMALNPSNPAPIAPTSVSLTSPMNTNKKVRVMRARPTAPGQQPTTRWQQHRPQFMNVPVLRNQLPVIRQQPPVLRQLSNDEVQRLRGNNPNLPVVSLDRVRVTLPKPLYGASNFNTPNLNTYNINRGQNTTVTSCNPLSINTASTSGTGRVPLTILEGIQGFTNPGHTIKILGNEFHGYVQRNGGVSSTAGSNVIDMRNITCENTQNQATAGGTIDLVVSNTDIIDGLAVPVAAHEIVIDDTEKEGVVEVITDKSTKQENPVVTCHDSQKPSTSRSPEKLAVNNKQTNQNQYEEMENELMCTICANLFIKAVTLGCSHSFCQYCIGEWKKKKTECPICRNKITSTIRTLVLDNIIEKMLETASEEDRADRKAAIEERKQLEEAETAKKNQQNATRTNSRGTRRAGRGRGNANTRGNQRNNARANNRPGNNNPLAELPLPPVITITDSPSTTESNDSENSDYDYDDYFGDEWYNGRPGAYYGGYGNCYNCGERGHWSNGCPYR